MPGARSVSALVNTILVYTRALTSQNFPPGWQWREIHAWNESVDWQPWLLECGVHDTSSPCSFSSSMSGGEEDSEVEAEEDDLAASAALVSTAAPDLAASS